MTSHPPDRTTPATTTRRAGTALSPQQEQALIALLSQPTIKQAAEACGVGETTLHRWLKLPAFRSAHRAARREAFAIAIGLVQRYTPMAVQTLAKVMSDPAAPHPAKVSAAVALLRTGREAIELDDLLERVEALEAAAQREGPDLRLRR